VGGQNGWKTGAIRAGSEIKWRAATLVDPLGYKAQTRSRPPLHRRLRPAVRSMIADNHRGRAPLEGLSSDPTRALMVPLLPHKTVEAAPLRTLSNDAISVIAWSRRGPCCNLRPSTPRLNPLRGNESGGGPTNSTSNEEKLQAQNSTTGCRPKQRFGRPKTKP
jgi:hypothetical protein